VDNNNPVQEPATPGESVPVPVPVPVTDPVPMTDPNPVPATQPEAPPQVQTPNIPQEGASSNNSNHMVVLFVVGLVIVILAVGGIYFLLNKQQSTVKQIENPITQNPPLPTDEPSLEDDLNSISIPLDANEDFAQVDQDLQQL